jgi:DNA-binding transcriptional ArsR family regulator
MFQPDTTFTIRDLDTLKVYADPLRAQIFEILVKEPQTIRQVAEKIGLSPSNLYYHVNLLEKHGLIQVISTRLVANIVEKVYRASALNLEVDHALLTFSTDEGKESINKVLTATLDATREDMQRSLQARAFALEQGAAERSRRADVTRVTSRISDELAEEFHRRLAELLQEFAQADGIGLDPDSTRQTYALMIAFYPSFYFHDSGRDQDIGE